TSSIGPETEIAHTTTHARNASQHSIPGVVRSPPRSTRNSIMIDPKVTGTNRVRPVTQNRGKPYSIARSGQEGSLTAPETVCSTRPRDRAGRGAVAGAESVRGTVAGARIGQCPVPGRRGRR